ncbi:MAG: threonine--tRNA ligase [bacterium]
MEQEKKQIYFHSSAHILAQAVKEIFYDVKLGIGPAINEGFYYDFDKEISFTSEDLLQIENKMNEIIKANLKIEKSTLSKNEALEFFKDEHYKIELIKEIEDEVVSIYKQGNFVDLCKGPHLQNTGEVKVIKLLSVAGAYWKGNEKNKMLQRIYGSAFETEQEKELYLKKLEEIKNRDHRKLGDNLDLFSIHPQKAGSGLIFWHPNLSIVRQEIENFWKKEHYKKGYQLVYTPHIAKIDIWEKSGHLDFYKENMFSPIDIDKQKYILKPMNCPFHVLIYQTKTRSFRDLPIKYAELGTVYRYEKSGVLHGMLRVRGFTQDDAHIFCTKEQLKSEIEKVIELAEYILKTFGYKEYNVYLSTRPEKYIGTLEIWDLATSSIEQALKEQKIKYEIDAGEGVFYGPKIDIKVMDAVGREWQGPTIQVDFNFPQKFNVEYINSQNQSEQVVMIHRTVMGAMERFIGGLIEHYKGAFPVWLAPVQVVILPITDNQIEYAKKIESILKENDFRVIIDLEKEKLGFKIRKAQLQKIPYMLVIGNNELNSNNVSVRLRTEENLGAMTLEEFIKIGEKVIKNKSLELM